MNLIVCVDKNWAIGRKNELLVNIPDDRYHFYLETRGNVVVMGRKTLESFPHGEPLNNRINIVLSRNTNYSKSGAIVVHNLSELMSELQYFPSDKIYVIGGSQIYKQMLPYCDYAYVTKVDHRYIADSYFPNLDQIKGWKQVDYIGLYQYLDLKFSFVEYYKEK